MAAATRLRIDCTSPWSSSARLPWRARLRPACPACRGRRVRAAVAQGGRERPAPRRMARIVRTSSPSSARGLVDSSAESRSARSCRHDRRSRSWPEPPAGSPSFRQHQAGFRVPGRRATTDLSRLGADPGRRTWLRPSRSTYLGGGRACRGRRQQCHLVGAAVQRHHGQHTEHPDGDRGQRSDLRRAKRLESHRAGPSSHAPPCAKAVPCTTTFCLGTAFCRGRYHAPAGLLSG